MSPRNSSRPESSPSNRSPNCADTPLSPTSAASSNATRDQRRESGGNHTKTNPPIAPPKTRHRKLGGNCRPQRGSRADRRLFFALRLFVLGPTAKRVVPFFECPFHLPRVTSTPPQAPPAGWAALLFLVDAIKKAVLLTGWSEYYTIRL